MSKKFYLSDIQKDFGIIGHSLEIEQVVSTVSQVAFSGISVLITGESGTGKEVVVNAIHKYSPRKHKPLVSVNCGAIPAGLIESELFGHKKGAFTDAKDDRRGYFEEADGGTIFLDEIGETPMETQVRLLRVLEQGEFMRVGDSKKRRMDVRILAATNQDLREMVTQGRFRQDLYFRLKAVNIKLPPLRKRKEDIPLFIEYFARRYSNFNNIPFAGFSPDAMEILENYDWEGNVRELKNFVESMMVLEGGAPIKSDAVRRFLFADQPEPSVVSQNQNLPVLTGNTPSQAAQEVILQQLFLLRQEVAEIKHQLSSGVQQMTHFLPPKSSSQDEIPIHNEPSDKQEILVVEEEKPKMTMREMEKKLIVETLKKNHYSRRQTAKDLEISERTLYRKISDYDLQ